jgi:hypothetical protein
MTFTQGIKRNPIPEVKNVSKTVQQYTKQRRKRKNVSKTVQPFTKPMGKPIPEKRGKIPNRWGKIPNGGK